MPYQDRRWPTRLIEKYQDILVPFIEQELPPATVFERPNPLPTREQIDCNAAFMAPFLTGNKRTKIPKVYDFFMFNAELAVLETRLFELHDVVDKVEILKLFTN